MGYDIYVKNRDGKTVMLKNKHMVTGGTYAVGGTDEAWISITYNYAPHYYRLWPRTDGGDAPKSAFHEMFTGHSGGIRSLYGRPIAEVVEMLSRGCETLKGEPDGDYWRGSEGNAREALFRLKLICEMAMHENPGADLTIEGD